MSKARDYVFTAFQTDPPTFDVSQQLYLVYQRERCPETKREHWQGFVIYKNAKTIPASQRSIGCLDCHHQRRLGTREQAASYCKKAETRVGDNYFEFGELPPERGQGHRSDLDAVVERIQNNASLFEIAQAHAPTFIRYGRGIRDLLQLRDCRPRPADFKPDVRVYTGPPGCGKTSSVISEFGVDNVFFKDTDNQWYDTYTGQQCVLFDDFIGQVSLPHILRITDRYRMQIQGKGSYFSLAASTTTIIFTSNVPTSSWWPQAPSISVEAFKRRVTVWRTWRRVESNLTELRDDPVYSVVAEPPSQPLLNDVFPYDAK